MAKSSKLFFGLGALILLVWAASRIFFWATDGFTYSQIAPQFAFRDNWNPPKSVFTDPEAKNALDQPYTYLARGAQFYAFESSDGQYVLKIVKQKHLTYSMWEKPLFMIPGYQAKRDQAKKRKIEKLLNAVKLSAEMIPQETALLYVHLLPTQTLNIKTTIKDKLGFKYDLEMDQMEFVLQRKARLFAPYLEEAIAKGDIQKGKQILKQTIDLLRQRSEIGIIDTDKRLLENIGFLDGKPIFIDFGEFKADAAIKSPVYSYEDLYKRTRVLENYLHKLSPTLATYLEEIL